MGDRIWQIRPAERRNIMDAKMLDGKTAIITGSSYGMGRSMAELFAEEGANVVLTARGKEKLDEVVDEIRGKGGKAIGVVADVCSTEDTKRVMEETLKAFGDLDILINNAWIGEQPGGAKMLQYSGHYVYFPGPECDPMDQAYACLYLASKMGKAVRGQVLQVCNGAFL